MIDFQALLDLGENIYIIDSCTNCKNIKMYQSIKWFLIIISTLITYNSYAYASSNADDRFVYIGAGFGVGKPAKKQFKHNSNTVIRLKKSRIYNVRVGYGFYPQMAIELAATLQPKSTIAYTLPTTLGKTKLSANIYTINLVYDLQDFKSFTPSVMFGTGLAQIKVHSAFSENNSFKIKKTHSNYFMWQIGGGISRAITDGLKIGATAKLQVFPKTRIKYQKWDEGTQAYVSPTPIKNSVGVAEFSLGFTYKLPI